MTPWAPILLTAGIAGAAYAFVWRMSGNARYGLAAASLVLALAAAALGSIATVALVFAVTLVLVSAALFMSGRAGQPGER